MSELVQCSWSALLLFSLLVTTKYRWTRPPVGFLLVCVFAGALSTVPAALCNAFLNQHTRFTILGVYPVDTFMSFLIGGGMGEEFFKMSAGLLAVLLWQGLYRDLGPVNRALGLVTVGLTFAVLENLLAYLDGGIWTMVLRGFLAVPLHGTMGMIHAMVINRCYERGKFLYLFVGYALAMGVHTMYNNLATLLPEPWSRIVLGGLVAVLLVWAARHWRRIPETEHLRPAPEFDDWAARPLTDDPAV